MHKNSLILMKEFADKFEVKGTVVDIGSYDINGNYKSLFPDAEYVGVDIQAGPNVDVLMGSEEWKELKDVDTVIMGQTLEHVADIPGLMAEISRVLKPGGLLCIIAPSEGPRHDYPIWVGNFSKERMEEAVTSAGFEIIECKLSDEAPFFDNRCIARKPIVVEFEIKKPVKAESRKYDK